MGALTFIIYDESYKIYNIDFTKGFLKMKNKGPDHTSYMIEHSQNINKISKDLLKMSLSRSELNDYSMHTFIYKYHRLSINDPSHDGNQPFEDPIMHMIRRYPDLKMRPKRKLLCDGVIYNYNHLKEQECFNDKDLQSSCDVEVILPLYIKYGIEKALNMLRGDFSLILTENTNTFILKEMNVFCARDKYGIRPLHLITNVSGNFYMFTSDTCSIPSFISNDTVNYNIVEVPPGCYWSLQTKKFTSYTDYTTLLKELPIVNKTDPETLVNVYKTLKEFISSACNSRIIYHNDMGILFDDNCTISSYLLITLVLNELSITNSSFVYHIFFNTYKTSNNHDTFINFLETSFPNLNVKFHIIHDDNILAYIEEHVYLKVILSSYGLDTIWNDQPIKCTNNHPFGFEIRYPFLDTDLVHYIKSLDIILKEKRSYKANTKPIDKYIIRKAFEETRLLPNDFLWCE